MLVVDSMLAMQGVSAAYLPLYSSTHNARLLLLLPPQGLVSWLDARDTASPGSTPRSSSTAAPTRYSTPRLATAAASPAGAAGAAATGGSAGSTGMRLGLLPLGSPVIGSGDVYSVAAAMDVAAGIDSPGSSVKAGDNAASAAKRRPSPRVSMAASLAAAAAAAAGVDAGLRGGSGAAAAGNDTGANREMDVCRVKDS
jgi:hypothetical protein